MRPADHVAGRADVTDHLSLLDLLSGRESLGILGEVAIEEQIGAARVFLIDRLSAPPLPRNSDDLSIRSRQNWGAPKGADVDREVLRVAASRRKEGILELRGVHTLDGDLESSREELPEVDVRWPDDCFRGLRPEERADLFRDTGESGRFSRRILGGRFGLGDLSR